MVFCAIYFYDILHSGNDFYSNDNLEMKNKFKVIE